MSELPAQEKKENSYWYRNVVDNLSLLGRITSPDSPLRQQVVFESVMTQGFPLPQLQLSLNIHRKRCRFSVHWRSLDLRSSRWWWWWWLLVNRTYLGLTTIVRLLALPDRLFCCPPPLLHPKPLNTL
jgi:hypothetical protein